MKRELRIDEIDGYLRDGGSIDEIMIQTAPEDHKRIWSKAGMVVDRQKEESHKWHKDPETGEWKV